MTNKEIAQEQINKQKEERRIELIKAQLVKKEDLERKLKEVDKEIEELETKEIKIPNTEGQWFMTSTGACTVSSN